MTAPAHRPTATRLTKAQAAQVKSLMVDGGYSLREARYLARAGFGEDPRNDEAPEYTQEEWDAYQRDLREQAIDRTPCPDGEDEEPFQAPGFQLVNVSHPSPFCCCSGCERFFAPREYALRDAVQRSDNFLLERSIDPRERPSSWPEPPKLDHELMSTTLGIVWEGDK